MARCCYSCPFSPAVSILWAFCAFVVLGVAAASTGNTTIPAPLVIAASQYWEGNDGTWSTFPVQIGSPAQNVRCLISTSGSATWAVVPEGCIADGPSNCPDLRGKLFNPNASSTWSFNNYYELQLESNLGYSGSGEFGFEKIGIGWQGSVAPILEHQVVSGIATDEFWLGEFGLTPRPTNFTDFNDPQPSFLETLKNKAMIPSLSWAYTAGAPYRFEKVPGSLVFGGYDSSKVQAANITVAFGPDISRDLTVGLQSISTSISGQQHNLLPTPIFTFIDSAIPQIWLPISSCTEFERAFGLTYDKTQGLYLVNDTLHASLLAQNASISFRLGNTTTIGETIDITLPYAAFDLWVDYPIVTNKTRYFPLKRADNDTQYTLGRTFLQEAYLTADYERSKFTVSQVRWDPNANQQIVAIPSVNSSSNSTAPPTSNPSHHSLSTGAIVGAAIGAFIIVLLAIAGAFFTIKRRREKKKVSDEVAFPPNNKEGNIGGFGKAELDAQGTASPGVEIGGTEAEKYEMIAAAQVAKAAAEPEPIFEMHGEGVAAHEMDTPVEPADRPHEVG